MDAITHDELRELLGVATPPCVSIFLPTHRAGRETQADRIQLKNKLNDAEQQLERRGMRPTLARDLLQPTRELLEDDQFWMRSTEGLAIFIANGFQRIYRLPMEVDDLVVVNDRFHLKPLVPLLSGKMFYVLALSLNSVRVLECTPYGCQPVSLPEDVSLSFDDAVRTDERRNHLQWHSSITPSAASVGGVFHGQGAENQRNREEDLLFFCRQLDDGVQRVMKDPAAPVVIAAADSIWPFYRKASNIKNLHDTPVPGNPEHVADQQLLHQAREALSPTWHEELNALQERYGTAASRSLASNDVTQIVPAAREGRVDVLFVQEGATLWGELDADKNRVALHPEPQMEDVDLIDEAAVQTILTSGQVVVLPPEEVPGNRELAAIYRY
jgi:hypothetical protein